MQDTVAQLLSYVLGIWRHRWVALVVAWMIAIAGWAYVARMPESYVATARVNVDTSSLLGPLMRGLTVSPNANERIAMMSRTLLSRPNLERLARMTDLDLEVQTEAQRDAMIRRLQSSISLSGTRGNNSLYSISVTHPDRETARRLTQSLIAVFIETSTSNQNIDNSQAQGFLNQQIAESEARLIEAENRLADFQRANVDLLPGERGDYYSRLRQSRANLQEARLQLRELQNRRSELTRQLEGEDPVFIGGGASGPVNSALDARIQAMRVQLDSMMTRYTERHPEIRRLEGLIAQLEEEKRLEYEAARSDSLNSGVGMSTSPVYQGMRSLLAETQAQVAALEVRVAEFEDRVEDLESKVNQIPDIEAQLTQLDRDYNVINRQHQQLLERRESARLSDDLQRNAGDVTFRVVDPPFVPLQPSQPNKPLLNAGVLVVALGGGGALALLLTLLHPIVTDARMLAQSTGLPLLGSVTYVKSGAEVRRARLGLAAFVACLCCLLLAFVVAGVVPGLLR
jgi:polysaccharide chain length determinant protein (PEP-CTERM system associated)